MSGVRKKAATPPPLPSLTPEAAAVLEARLAALKEALAGGAEPKELAGLLAPGPPDPAWEDHLLAALVQLAHPAVPPLLVLLFGQGADRRRQKALKKALHLLKTKGVPVAADLLARKEREVSSGSRPAVTARVSPVLGLGERYVILEGSRQALGATMLVARLSDLAGLKEFHALEATRSQREELWQHLREQGLEHWIEVPPPYATKLLEEALALNPDAAGAKDYAALRSRLWQHLGRPEEAPRLEEELPPLSAPELATALEQARHLGRHPLFHPWLPAPEEVAPWVQKIQEAEASPLILAEHQQRTRLEGILEEAARALFPLESRALWQRRLLDMAFVLKSLGRSEEARAARAAAQDLAARSASPLLGESPFLLGLVEVAIWLAREYLRRTEPSPTPSGLVAPPGAAPLIFKG